MVFGLIGRLIFHDTFENSILSLVCGGTFMLVLEKWIHTMWTPTTIYKEACVVAKFSFKYFVF